MISAVKYNPDVHHRQSIRLRGYDYAQPGLYFVTVCTYKKDCILDDPALATLVRKVWEWTTRPTRGAGVGEFVVMPNHVHGIVRITSPTAVGAQRRCFRREQNADGDTTVWQGVAMPLVAAPLPSAHMPAPRILPGSLAAIVRAFKPISTKRVNRIRGTPGGPVWQRNYYERVIRNEDELGRIRQYIRDNPAKWADDPNNPANVTPPS